MKTSETIPDSTDSLNKFMRGMESGLLAIEIIKIVRDIRVSFVPIKVRKCLFNLHGIQPGEKKKKQNFTGRKVSGFTLEQEIIILL